MRTPVDLVQILTTSSGTGPFALGNANLAFFGVEKLIDNHFYSYSVQQGGNLEWGYGQYLAASRTLTRVVADSSHAGAPVPFQAGAIVAFTFTSLDIADLIAEAGSVVATAKAAFNAYGLQWAPWFNATPLTGELLGLYVSPIDFYYPADFRGSAFAPPLQAPSLTWTSTLDRQVGGAGAWNNIGGLELETDGSVSLTTAGHVAITINAGDRLRWAAPAIADSSVVGFAMTLKGLIP